MYFSEYMQKKPTAVTDLLVFAPRCKQSCLAKVTVLKILMPTFLKTELNFCQVLSHLLNSCVHEGHLEYPDLSLCFNCSSALIGSPMTNSSVWQSRSYTVQSCRSTNRRTSYGEGLESTEISSQLWPCVPFRGWVQMGMQHDCLCFGLAKLV